MVRSLTASVSEYGDDVRDIGMTSIERIVPLPADSSVSTRSPSSVPVLMCAVVSEPSAILPSMVNVTRASPLLQRHVRHRADLDARHRHGVAHGEAAGFGKQGLVADRGRQRPQLLGLKTHGDDEQDQHHADEPGANEPASAVLKHLGSAHLPPSCVMAGKHGGAARESETRTHSLQM